MNPTYRTVVEVLLAILLVSFFVAVMPSVIGLLLSVMLLYCVKDLMDRRRTNTARSLNSAIRAVCHHDGSVAKIAGAYSRRGPLRGPCYEFARRLLTGERPIEAAAMSRVPLQLSTAVALDSPSVVHQDDASSRHDDAFALPDWNMMPAYAQLLYLSLTAIITCAVLTFITIFVAPTMEVLFDEFGISTPWWSLANLTDGLSPSWLLLPAALLMIVVPILNAGHVLGIPLPRWLPTMPRLAEQKAETLTGLADAIDAGWPVRRALDVGHSLSEHRIQRRALQNATQMIDQGAEPADALKGIGWIDARETSWLTGASPKRTAELLRTIADQSVRDATANLRWLMAILFPVVILLLSVAVLAYAVGLFAMTYGLVR